MRATVLIAMLVLGAALQEHKVGRVFSNHEKRAMVREFLKAFTGKDIGDPTTQINIPPPAEDPVVPDSPMAQGPPATQEEQQQEEQQEEQAPPPAPATTTPKPKVVHPAGWGIHIRKRVNFAPWIGDAGEYILSPREACQTIPAHADRGKMEQCELKWGDRLVLAIGLGPNMTLYRGSRIQAEFDFNLAGLLGMLNFDPLHIDCKACGAHCPVEVPKMNGMTVLPTKKDILGNFGSFLPPNMRAMVDMLPDDAKMLGQIMNGMMMVMNSKYPGMWGPEDFMDKQRRVHFSDDGSTLMFPMPPCPWKSTSMPDVTMDLGTMAPTLKGFKFHLRDGALGAELPLPKELPMGFPVDMISGMGHLRLKVWDRQKRRLLNVDNAFSVNSDTPLHLSDETERVMSMNSMHTTVPLDPNMDGDKEIIAMYKTNPHKTKKQVSKETWAELEAKF